ncbi:MAG: hypothetical protein PHQ23_12815, partial [Candidatus Wallbacteria bacterium]|nr:hypothetical protein [Candidatus Wallbacteria bacterium]
IGPSTVGGYEPFIVLTGEVTGDPLFPGDTDETPIYPPGDTNEVPTGTLDTAYGVSIVKYAAPVPAYGVAGVNPGMTAGYIVYVDGMSWQTDNMTAVAITTPNMMTFQGFIDNGMHPARGYIFINAEQFGTAFIPGTYTLSTQVLVDTGLTEEVDGYEQPVMAPAPDSVTFQLESSHLAFPAEYPAPVLQTGNTYPLVPEPNMTISWNGIAGLTGNSILFFLNNTELLAAWPFTSDPGITVANISSHMLGMPGVYDLRLEMISGAYVLLPPTDLEDPMANPKLTYWLGNGTNLVDAVTVTEP